ncbi:UNVERIFIED_ORG: hypothetical protein GGE36_002723 [Rhizobium etli]
MSRHNNAKLLTASDRHDFGARAYLDLVESEGIPFLAVL